jgi:hypothetical protein
MTRTRCGNCGAEYLVGDGVEGARKWFRRHRREECAVRGAATTATRMSDAELLAKAKRLRPIPIDRPVDPPRPNGEWWDSLNSDPWGAPPRGPQLLARAWGGRNCLQGAIASILGATTPERIPDPADDYADGMEGWLDRYAKRIQRETGYRLERFPASLCPPKNPNQLWLATIRMDGPADHVVVCRGFWIVHDPSDLFRGRVPLDRLIDGMVVTPARRIVPVFSPRGSGYAVVAA